MVVVTRGGKREGSGRKSISEAGPGIVLGCRIPPDLHAALMAEVQRQGVTTAVLVTAALRAYLESRQDEP